MADYDLVIRNGTVIDGSGAEPFAADVAVRGGRIAEVGVIAGQGAEEIDARGRIVTPGFVDIHTHYDGQVTWEHTLAPSSNHGVTTVVGGNCGVGFAPCRAADRASLIAVMEGVEDIPEAVMADGIPWNWETFPDYLDALEARNFDIDVAVQAPHSPIRVYVMGERGLNREPSTEADRQQMADLVTEAIRAGAIGVSTSRSLSHRKKNGELAPSIESDDEEVLALARGLRAAGTGVFQLVPELGADPEGEFELVEKIARTAQRPVSFTVLETEMKPNAWRDLLAGAQRMTAEGFQVRGQVAPRPVGILMGLDLSLNPIVNRPSYRAIAHLPLAERVALLRDPAMKARILAEESIPDPQPLFNMVLSWVDKLAPLGDPPNYVPTTDQLLGARAEREGATPMSLAYDLMLEQDGRAVLYLPSANLVTGTTGPLHEMLAHDDAVIGLGDGGAHYGFICDAGYPTFVLTYWTRDAAPDERFSLAWAVNALTRRAAETVGLLDRGLVAEGYKADLNVIDYDRLALGAPVATYDLPKGARRIWQQAKGYDATIVSGAVTYRNGERTGTLPGRLVRGAAH